MMDSIVKNEERAVLALRGLYQRYGYVPYKMSRFEEYDLYVRSRDFLVSDQIITFSDSRGKLLALKPDVTLSIVKNAPEKPGVIQKLYYNENVYRDYREIMQAGLECVGDLGDYEISEVVLLAVKSLELLGGNYVLDISHMGLIAAILEGSGLDSRQQKQAMACIRRKNDQELRKICEGNPQAAQKLLSLPYGRGGRDYLEETGKVLTTQAEKKAWEELREICDFLEARGYGEHICIDYSVSSDLGYYSGVVFRGYMEGVHTGILSGGQYDKLPRKIGRNARAIGFAVYLDLLQELEQRSSHYDVDTLILHDGSVDRYTLADAAEEAAGEGTVLVAAKIPENRRWKKLIRFEKGVRLSE